LVCGRCAERLAGGIDFPRDKRKLCRFPAPGTASNMDVEGWWVMSRKPCRRIRSRALTCGIGGCLFLSLGVAWHLHAQQEEPGRSARPAGDQPEAETPHHAVKRFEIGQGPRSYWLFEPDAPKPDGKAPVVVFLHGWFAVNPGFYGAWIDHLVRDGRIVIFPRYQNDVGTLPQDFLPNALAAIRDALGVLHDGVGHVRPDPLRFALVGHSAGGNLAAQIAAVASDPHSDLPLPQAVIAVMPGEVVPSAEPVLSRIPATTLMTVMVGEEDVVVGDLRGRQIFAEATAIPRARKRFVLFRSDRHGVPALIAEHTAPTGVHHRLDNGEGLFRSLQMSFGDVNALDRVGFWRMADITMDAAFNGQTLDDVTRDPERFRHLGFWSDGHKVNQPVVGSDLSAIPRVIPGNGLRLFPWSVPPKPKVALDTNSRP
jgi:pimeloyl-ACP methyl ester carboxylesterase